jgi:hypothetical protein
MSLLGLMGEVEWARFAVGPTREGKPRPPLLVWRFKVENESLEERLADAVHSFSGRVEWLLDESTRNRVLMPREVSEALGPWRTDSEVLLHLAETRPKYSRDSMEDLNDLLDHIEQALE